MDKLNIYEILKQVSYPGFSKNIVDFGMVRSVEQKDGVWVVDLHIVTSEEDKPLQVRQDIEKALSSAGAGPVQINIDTEKHRVETKKMDVNQDPAAFRKQFEFADQVIAVASGKGGVGKSTVAANLALSLSRRGLKVGLLDLDVYGPSVPTIFHVTDAPVVQDEHHIYPVTQYGVELMSFGFFIGENTPVIWRGPMVMKLVDQLLNDVKWSKLDVLILDLPPGTGDVQLTLSQKIYLTGAVIVTTPQDLALIDVSRGAGMFQKMNVPVLGVVENMSYHVCSECGHRDHVFSSGGGRKESARLDVPFLGALPLSGRIMADSDAGKPTVFADPDCEESRAFENIVETLLRNLN